MIQVVEHIVKALVDHPDYVFVEQKEEGNSLLLVLSVHEDDMGKVIGKNGRVANAIRNVVNACGFIHKKNVRLEIAE